MITKRIIIDQIEITGEFRHVQVRQATVIEEDGVELSRSFQRHVVSPDKDASNEDPFVKSICDTVHTAELKLAYAQQRAKARLPHAR
jgi:hypothetical protein